MTKKTTMEQATQTDGLVSVARNDREAFGLLFDEFYPQIFAYCKRRLVRRTSAEDVTSEVFLKVAGSIQDFPGTSTEEFRKWLFRIATNQINAHLRKSIRRRELLESAVELGRIKSSVVETIIDSHTQLDWQSLYEALGELSEREQSIISLRFFGSLSHNQISDVLVLKAGSVRVTLSRALEKLKARLCNHETSKPALSNTKHGVN